MLAGKSQLSKVINKSAFQLLEAVGQLEKHLLNFFFEV